MSNELVINRNDLTFVVKFEDKKHCTVCMNSEQVKATYDLYIKAICFNGILKVNDKIIKGIKLQESENTEVKNIVADIENRMIDDIIEGKTLLEIGIKSSCHISYEISYIDKILLEKAFKKLTNRDLDINKLNSRLGNLRTKEEIVKGLKAQDFGYSDLARKAYNLKDSIVTDFKIALKDLINWGEIEEANQKDKDIKSAKEKMNVKILNTDKDKIGSIFATVEISNDIEKATFKVSNISDFGYSVKKISECSKEFEQEAEQYLYKFPPINDEVLL